MFDPQAIVFREALHWPATTGVFFLGLGALFTLQGFRFARLLLAASAGLLGFLIGMVTRLGMDLDPATAAIGGAAIFGVLTLINFRASLYVNGLATLAVFGLFLAARFELAADTRLSCAALGALAGLFIPAAAGRSAPIVITSLQGALLMLVGFVSIAAEIAPSLAQTFVAWSDASFFISPMLLTMLVVLGYSVQSNMLQGDITTGGSFTDLHAQ